MWKRGSMTASLQYKGQELGGWIAAVGDSGWGAGGRTKGGGSTNKTKIWVTECSCSRCPW